MTLVKVCGITNLEDAIMSADAGADALGFNFYRPSPRYLEPAVCGSIVAKLPRAISKVGVFVNATVDEILQTQAAAGIETIQLHGDEGADFVSDLKNRTNSIIIKVVRMSPGSYFPGQLYKDADAFLLDVFDPNLFGGVGKTADWDIAAEVRRSVRRLYLAGGLDPNNVGAAVEKVRPYAVDAASGLESEKGKKDPEKVIAFVRNAKNA